MTAPLIARGDRHLVDEFGLVGCPVRGSDVDVDVCLECRNLLEARRDVDGRVVEIRCRPSLASRPDAFDVGFLGWIGRRPR